MVNLEELLVPWLNIVRSFLLVFIILRRRWVVLVVCGPLNYLKEEGGMEGGNGGRGERKERKVAGRVREGKRERKGRMDCR